MGRNDSSNDSSSEEEERRRKSKKSKNKKHKSKEKKHKKHKRRRRSSSEYSSNQEEEQWVVKGSNDDKKSAATSTATETKSELPKLERDEWMSSETFVPTFSNDVRRAKRKQEREEEKSLRSIDQTGQHPMELNPYWKDGGTGLPEEDTKSKTVVPIGDGGLSWLKKSYERAKQQAKEEGRSLEEVAEERWGSLEIFFNKLEEAEAKAKGFESKSSSGFRRPRRDSNSSNDEEEHHSRNKRQNDDYPRSYSSGRHFSSSSRHRERENVPSWKKASSSTTTSKRRDRSSSSSPERVKYEERRREKQSANSLSVKPESSESPMKQSVLEETEEQKEIEKANILTDKEMNELNAKILKAEMFGNTVLVASLKQKLREAEDARDDFIKSGSIPERATKVVTKIIMEPKRRIKDKPTETHKDGQRVRYFPDDDKYTLKNMFQAEKMNTAENENALFARLAGKTVKATEDYDLDEIFVDKASSSKQEHKDKQREIKQVIDEDKRYKRTLDDCQWCFEGKRLQKNIILSMGQKSFLCVPPFQSLTEGHTLIVPMSHVSSATQLDEDVWEEMQKFRKALVRMFRDNEQDVVVFETATYLKRQPHMYIECVPMPNEIGELAPIYFKKAIQECETEWSQNKKVVEMKGRDVRRCVSKELPYFSVDFGDDNCGFAHVIEDEQDFPSNFAQEIIGGMLELDHHLWRKRKQDDFNTQRNKVMKLLKEWAPYDWTKQTQSETNKSTSVAANILVDSD